MPPSLARSAPTEAALNRPKPQPLAAIVRVLNARAHPSERKLEDEPIVVGAGAQASIVVADSKVSRAHVEFSLAPEGVVVRDLGSKNGTFYLGQRVEKMVLAPGSRVRIGDTDIAVDPDLESLSHSPEEAQYRGLYGASPAMRKLFGMLLRLEGALVSVLIEGESGVGKELIAQAIHQGSAVSQGPFIPLNCGAIPRELVLSELFGHKKGAFTGATENRVGAFEAAHNGTLFLDEIGELPLDVQPVLLRALESGEFRRVGETESRKVKVRTLAATNRDVDEEIRVGRFREDLFYRLAVVRLTVPSLRERPQDIELLAQLFAANFGHPPLPPHIIERLSVCTFPGNVRELRNAVQAYAALGDLPESLKSVDQLDAALRAFIDAGKPYQEQKEQLLHHFTRTYLELLLAKTSGNQSEAARISGLDRSYIGKLAQKLGVNKR
ncbi:MAG: sigma 54-dependent Fis family transcriptional regulator [Polyangiaceae bacterium]|nr:sigma 54-dependent Fis family transcriptional regulator [Polyangiaceae bacterium]